MAPSSSDQKKRPYVASRFILEMDGGKTMGTLQSVDGGAFKSDVVEETVGREGLATRYPGRPKFDDITIQVGMSMAPNFWKWIKDSFNYNASRRNGAIVALDYNNRERWRRTFTGALIQEVGFPALDSASKEAAYITVKFAVEGLKEEEPHSGKHTPEQQALDEWQKQAKWLPSNFTFKIDNFALDSNSSVKVDGFSIKQNVIDCPVGGFLETTKEPGRVDFPKLSVTVLQTEAKEWVDWYDKFVRAGNHTADQEKTGHISYLARDQDQNQPLMVLDIYGIGILGISPIKHGTKAEEVQKVKVDLYCESIEMKPGPGDEGTT